MKKIFIQILLCLFFLYPITGQILSDECGSVIGGFGKPVPLKTGWLFRKGDNPDWKDPLYDDSGWMRKNLPDYGKDKEVKVTGFIWYRCRILIPENMKDWNEPLGIEIGELRDADEVYFNGVLIGQTGQLVPTFSPDMHKIRIYSIPKKLFINGSNLIAVRNYSSTSYAGFSEVPVIYNETDLIYGISRKNVFGIMAGYVFILMGVYFIIASVVKSTNRGNLFFSLFTIALGFYTLLRTQYRYRMFDDFSDSFKCELLVLELLPILFLSFIFYYLNYKRNYFLLGYEILIGCLFVFTLFSKTTLQWLLIVDIFVYTLIYPVALTFFIIHASYKENKEKLKFLLFGIAVLIPCIVIDSLTAIEVIKFPGTMYFGFTIFLVSISIQLSEEMVQNLKDYLKQEKELIKMEKVKTDFLFNVSNEFKIYMDNFEKLFANSNGNGKGKISKAPKLPLDETDKYVGLILSIFKDAVTLRSIEDKTFTPVITRFSVKQVILECIGLVESALGETRKNKTITISPDAYETTGAKKLFFLIAYHLIENAYKYTKKTDRIQIIFKSENDRAQLQVIDEGPGISKELQSTVFRKFVRGDYLKKESEIAGAGIGLTIVKAVSEYLGGTVELSSSDGFGSRFTVTLPLKAAVQ